MATAGDGDQSGSDQDVAPNDLPWWEAPDVIEDSEAATGVSYANEPSGLDPKLLDGIRPPDGTGLKLVYNAMAVWSAENLFMTILDQRADLNGSIAYIHILLAFRLPSLDTFYLTDAGVDPKEVKLQLDYLLPFLKDAKSTLRYESVRDAYSSVRERLNIDQVCSSFSLAGTPSLMADEW